MKLPSMARGHADPCNQVRPSKQKMAPSKIGGARTGPRSGDLRDSSAVIASGAKQSIAQRFPSYPSRNASQAIHRATLPKLDCFVALLLAMTARHNSKAYGARTGPRSGDLRDSSAVIASGAKQSIAQRFPSYPSRNASQAIHRATLLKLDCFVASLLAMTARQNSAVICG